MQYLFNVTSELFFLLLIKHSLIAVENYLKWEFNMMSIITNIFIVIQLFIFFTDLNQYLMHQDIDLYTLVIYSKNIDRYFQVWLGIRRKKYQIDF